MRFFFLFGLLVFSVPSLCLPNTRGIRVSPGYSYGKKTQVPTKVDAEELATRIVHDAAESSINTLFVQAYNSTYGAFFPTQYPSTVIESGLGSHDFLGKLIQQARRKKIQVIAWLPVNDFKSVWTEHADWRSKQKDGTDYKPGPDVYPLSAGHPKFRDWYKGFIEDILTRYPLLDGIEAAEGSVDHHWDLSADFNPEALATRIEKTKGTAEWKIARANDLTELYRIAFRVTHNHSKKAFLVQTWPADEKGALIPSEKLRDSTGLDLDGILNGKGNEKPDYMIAELIWQQWKDKYPAAHFDSTWTASAAKDFISKTKGRAIPLVHVELTPFGSTTPTLEELKRVLETAVEQSCGVSLYDYYQAKEMGALPTIHAVYRKHLTFPKSLSALCK